MITVLGWLGFIICMLGYSMLQNKKPSAFLVWNIGNIIWIALALFNNDYPQVTMFTVYTFMNVKTYMSWRKEENG